MRIFSLKKICMKSGCQRILPKIRKTQKGRKCHTSHASFQRSLLRIKPIRPYSFMPHQMKRFIFIRIIGLLKNSHIICTALMQVCILLCIYRINFQSYHAEIFPCQSAGFTDIFHITLAAAFSCQDQNFFHSAVCDHLHLFFNLFHRKLHPIDMVVAVKTTVNTVVFTIIRNI